MRDIKFRAQDDYTHKFEFADFTFPNTGEFPSCMCLNPDTFGQYTGLKDCDGVEIYEGDFVKELEGWREEFGQIAQVKFVEEDCAFMLVYPDGDYIPLSIGRRYKVIGNIYDNPEFMKEDEQ